MTSAKFSDFKTPFPSPLVCSWDWTICSTKSTHLLFEFGPPSVRTSYVYAPYVYCPMRCKVEFGIGIPEVGFAPKEQPPPPPLFPHRGETREEAEKVLIMNLFPWLGNPHSRNLSVLPSRFGQHPLLSPDVICECPLLIEPVFQEDGAERIVLVTALVLLANHDISEHTTPSADFEVSHAAS